MNNELITNRFSKFKKITSTSVEKFKKEFPKEYEELNQIYLNNPTAWVTIQNVIIGIIENKTLKRCKTCGKIIPFPKSEQDYCCPKCINNNQEVRNKIKQTCLEKYGVDNPAKADICKEKSKQTCLEKYGVENGFQSEHFKQKVKETCLKKYGVEYVTQSKQMKEAARKTCLERYGMDHYVNIEKQRKTVLKQTYEKILKYIDVEPLFSLDEYKGVLKENKYKWKCKKCGNIFEDHIFEHYPRCLICNPKIKQYSNQEKDLVSFIKEIYKGEILENNRSIIKPYELDIVIPEKKLAFEYNGTFWHSELSPGFKKDENKCLLKTNLCEEKGYELIHIWEFEWVNKNEIVKNLIMNKISDKRFINSNEYFIKELSKNDTNNFLNENYIYGKTSSSISIGLFINNELKEIMTFSKPKNSLKEYDWRLMMYYSKINSLNGFNILISYFENKFNPKDIICYDNRFNNLNKQFLLNNGFNKVKETDIDYFYVNEDGIKYSSSQCKRNGIKKILGDKYHPDLTEFENMAVAKFYRIFNCGNLVFKKNFK